LIVAVLLGAWSICPSVCSAQDASKPLATISFSGHDALVEDLGLLGKLGDNPQLQTLFEQMLQMGTQGQGLTGLDLKRPWGVVITPGSAGQLVDGYGFLPVTDLKALLGVLQQTGMPMQDLGNGVTQITVPMRHLFIKQKGAWAFICTSPDALANTADDPEKLLGGVHQKYDLAVRLLVRDFSPAMRQTIIGFLEMGVEAGLMQMPGESDEQFAVRGRLARQSIQQMITMIDELDMVRIGLAMDNKTEKVYLDFDVTAQEGTKTAEKFALVKKGKTNFAGFLLPDAALTINQTSVVHELDIAQIKNTIASIRVKAVSELDNQGLPAGELAKAKQMLEDLLGVIEETIEQGRIDLGLAAILEPNALTVLGGCNVADGVKLEKVLHDLAQTAAAENDDVAKAMKWDAGEHQGVRLHSLSIPFPDDENREKAVKLFGERLDVVLGTSDKSFYLSVGRDAAAKLKAAIDLSKAEAGKEVPPSRISLALTPVARFVAEMADDPQAKQMATKLAAVLQQGGSDDHITITGRSIPNGVRQRLEIEQGVIKAIGAMVQMANQARQEAMKAMRDEAGGVPPGF
jgi:hypothetical protein